MSNEMLKDAKKWLSQMHVVLSEQSNQTQIKSVQEKIELVEWLIEQAKQIEKWNDYNNQVIVANVKLKSQNKRYREAIEDMLKNARHKGMVILIGKSALEGEGW